MGMGKAGKEGRRNGCKDNLAFGGVLFLVAAFFFLSRGGKGENSEVLRRECISFYYIRTLFSLL